MERKIEKASMLRVSYALRDLLRKHAEGQPVFREMAERIERREKAKAAKHYGDVMGKAYGESL